MTGRETDLRCRAAGSGDSGPRCWACQGRTGPAQAARRAAAAAARSSPAPASAWLPSWPAACSSDAFAVGTGEQACAQGGLQRPRGEVGSRECASCRQFPECS